jgi:hypothetical protein
LNTSEGTIDSIPTLCRGVESLLNIGERKIGSTCRQEIHQDREFAAFPHLDAAVFRDGGEDIGQCLTCKQPEQ